jgi:multimeric flavodoxin WrbA
MSCLCEQIAGGDIDLSPTCIGHLWIFKNLKPEELEALSTAALRRKVKDDYPGLAEKVRAAGAVVVGGYSPYGAVNGFTKAFLERLFSLRRQNGLNRGKPAVAVATGIGRGAPGLEEAGGQISHALKLEGMEILGELKAVGNPECMVCGFGETCPMSALPWIFGEDTRVTPEKFSKVEDQTKLWQESQSLGREIARRLSVQLRM